MGDVGDVGASSDGDRLPEAIVPAQAVRTPNVRGQCAKRPRGDGSDDDDLDRGDRMEEDLDSASRTTVTNRMTITLRFVPLLWPLSPVQIRHVELARGPPGESLVMYM